MANSVENYVHPTGLRYIKTDFGIVYCATNKLTGHKYVGSTLSSLHRRKYRHEREKACSSLSQAITEYGAENFEWTILGEKIHRTELVKIENEWIDKLNTLDPSVGYNLRKSGKNGISNAIARQRNSLGQKERYKDPKQRLKTAEATRIMYQDLAVVAKNSASRGGRPFEAFKDGKSYGVFITYKLAAKALNLSLTGVSKVVKGQRNSCYGFTFKHIEVNTNAI